MIGQGDSLLMDAMRYFYVYYDSQHHYEGPSAGAESYLQYFCAVGRKRAEQGLHTGGCN